ARLERLEPMELVQQYTLSFHRAMDQLGNLPPSIEPRASGHIPQQIEMIQGLMAKGLAYEVNGSVYFDLEAYRQNNAYGQLSGRVVDDLVAGAGNERRSLASQSEKRKPEDFALWKKAEPEHIMRWNSPWGLGFPGWHIECSAMSAQYLGTPFDIHGGGMDLLFPHHESEIAQTTGCYGCGPAKLWMHNNMVTINGQKMGKSLGNFITLDDLFAGTHEGLSQAYDPMSIRFFILQAQYRSTLDFSDPALLASSKGYQRWIQGLRDVMNFEVAEIASTVSSDEGLGLLDSDVLESKARAALNDDLNSPVLIALLYEVLGDFQILRPGKVAVSPEAWNRLRQTVKIFVQDVLGFPLTNHGHRDDQATRQALNAAMEVLIRLRQEAKEAKNWAMSDQIRDQLHQAGIKIMDDKEGSRWSL
ncbi:MAG: cysteine--tRNA ligase, partial [Bacteroidota bacterium]